VKSLIDDGAVSDAGLRFALDERARPLTSPGK
jgi:hypothetical protein